LVTGKAVESLKKQGNGMPKASEHSSSSIQKLLYIGDSGTGKTTSLFSLLQAGYKLRIYDFDNLLSPLISITRGKAPELLDNIEFMSFRDEMATTSQGPIVPSPRAFTDGLKAFDKWEDGSKPKEWGPDYVAVLDSFTTAEPRRIFLGPRYARRKHVRRGRLDEGLRPSTGISSLPNRP
jgi:hypothetical protein